MTGGNGRPLTWTAANMVASIVQGTTTVAFDGACPFRIEPIPYCTCGLGGSIWLVKPCEVHCDLHQ